MFWRRAEGAHTQQVAIRIGLGGSELLSRKDAVKPRLDFRMGLIDGCHLLGVAAGYHSGCDAMAAKGVDKGFYTGHGQKLHLLLKAVQTLCNLALCALFSGKEGLIDVGQRLSLNLRFQMGEAIIFSYLLPEVGVLAFGIHHHAIKVKQG